MRNHSPKLSEIVTVKQAAKLLGLSYHATYRLVENGTLQVISRLDNLILLDRASVEAERRRRIALGGRARRRTQ